MSSTAGDVTTLVYFAGLVPFLLVCLVGLLVCAARFPNQPSRYGATGALLGVCLLTFPAFELAKQFLASVLLGPIGAWMEPHLLLAIVSNVVTFGIIPVAAVLIAVTTRSPSRAE